jgi:hypothetical protein
LGFIFFPVDLIHLQVQKLASTDLHNSQFIKNWGEIDPEFFPEIFDTGMRVLTYPQARIGRISVFSLQFCPARKRGNAPLSTL